VGRSESLRLKKKVEEWRRFMLENPPPEPESIASIEEWDYYDEDYAIMREKESLRKRYSG